MIILKIFIETIKCLYGETNFNLRVSILLQWMFLATWLISRWGSLLMSTIIIINSSSSPLSLFFMNLNAAPLMFSNSYNPIFKSSVVYFKKSATLNCRVVSNFTTPRIRCSWLHQYGALTNTQSTPGVTSGLLGICTQISQGELWQVNYASSSHFTSILFACLFPALSPYHSPN